MKDQAHGVLYDDAVLFFGAINPLIAAIARLTQPSRYFSPAVWRHRR